MIKLDTIFQNGSCGGVHPSSCVTILLIFRISYYFYSHTRKLVLKLGSKNLNLRTWFWVTNNTLKKIGGDSFLKSIWWMTQVKQSGPLRPKPLWHPTIFISLLSIFWVFFSKNTKEIRRDKMLFFLLYQHVWLGGKPISFPCVFYGPTNSFVWLDRKSVV